MKNKPFFERLAHALAGVISAWKSEASFRFQCITFVAALSLFAWLDPQPVWWLVFIGVSGLVLVTELLNTALEHVIDCLHPEYHPLMKIAKDCAAGAVLIASVTALLVFACFLVEHVSV